MKHQEILKEKNAVIRMKVNIKWKVIIASIIIINGRYNIIPCYGFVTVMSSIQDEEISELKAKMDDMADEFGDMLKVFYCLKMITFNHLFIIQ